MLSIAKQSPGGGTQPSMQPLYQCRSGGDCCHHAEGVVLGGSERCESGRDSPQQPRGCCGPAGSRLAAARAKRYLLSRFVIRPAKGRSHPFGAPAASKLQCNFSNKGSSSQSLTSIHKKPGSKPGFLWMAVREGFEPSIRCRIHTFQACSFSHSDTSPTYSFCVLPGFILAPKSARLRARYRPAGALSGKASESATRTPHQRKAFAYCLGLS